MNVEGPTRRLTNTMAKGGGVVFAGSIFSSLVALALHILLSRTLGAEEYGIYALGLSIFLITSKISLLGVPMGVLRFVAAYSGTSDVAKIKGTIFSGFWIVLLVSLPLSLGFFICSELVSERLFQMPRLSWVLKIFLISLPFYNLSVVGCFVMRARRMMVHYVLFRDVFRRVVNIGVVIIFFLAGYRLNGAAMAFLLAACVAVIVNVGLLKRSYLNHVRGDGTVYELRKLFRFSIPVLFIGLSFLLINQTSRVILGYFEQSHEVGIYSVAANLSMLIILMLNCVDAIFAPIISELHHKKEIGQIGQLFKTSTRWVLSLSGPITMFLFLFSEEFMGIFGLEFKGGNHILMILAAAYLVNAATGSVAFLLQMSGHQDIELKNSLGILAVCIVLNIFMVKYYGLIGAAVATGLSLVLLNILRLLEVLLLLKVHPYDIKYLKPISAICISALFGFLIFSLSPLKAIFWIWKILAISFVYVTLLLLMGLEKEDNDILLALRYRVLGGHS